MAEDSSTFEEKTRIRHLALSRLSDPPMILETHAGYGHLYERLYDGKEGVAIEKRIEAARVVCIQRPTWPVYCAAAEKMLGGGITALWPFNFLDLDPYGSPFEVMEAFFRSRELLKKIVVVVTDGLRRKVKVGGAWNVEALAEIVNTRGNDVYGDYLGVAEAKCRKILDRAGFNADDWQGYYCGASKEDTHYMFTALKR